MKQSTYKMFFLISNCLACNTEKTLQLKITKKKKMNIANFINIYTNVYTNKLNIAAWSW